MADDETGGLGRSIRSSSSNCFCVCGGGDGNDETSLTSYQNWKKTENGENVMAFYIVII
jgi:hypothetical protein